MATEAEVAAHLKMTDRTVRDLKSRGVFSAVGRDGYDLDACREAYILQLREQAAGRGVARPVVGGLDLVSERARLAKEQADHRGLLNTQLRGSLVPLADLEAVVGGLVDAMRTRLLAVPSRGASPARRQPIAASHAGDAHHPHP